MFFLVPGLGGIASVTVSGLHAYDTTLLSVHMVQHMVLSMVAPIFLALGAPMTLALRMLHGAPRRRLLAVVHSHVAKVFTFPLVAFGLFVATPFALYFTGLYEQTLRHELAARARPTRTSSWSAACSSGRCSASTRCPAAGPTRPERC